MHELAIGLPLHTLRGWAFAGMIFQLPLVYITDALKARLKNEQVRVVALPAPPSQQES